MIIIWIIFAIYFSEKMHKLRHHKVQNIPKDLLNPTLLFQMDHLKMTSSIIKGKIGKICFWQETYFYCYLFAFIKLYRWRICESHDVLLYHWNSIIIKYLCIWCLKERKKYLWSLTHVTYIQRFVGLSEYDYTRKVKNMNPLGEVPGKEAEHRNLKDRYV